MKVGKKNSIIKAVFLDRDGVINRYPGDRKYVTRLKDFKLLAGVTEAVRLLTGAGFKVYVISNQAGVSKGLYSRSELDRMTRFMLKAITKAGGKIQKALYCLHLSGANCSCRKPKTRLLKKAIRNKTIDLKSSYFIGDSLIDVETGRAFGCKTIMVLSGREKLKNASQWTIQPDFIAKNLLSAAKNILAGKYERA